MLNDLPTHSIYFQTEARRITGSNVPATFDDTGDAIESRGVFNPSIHSRFQTPPRWNIVSNLTRSQRRDEGMSIVARGTSKPRDGRRRGSRRAGFYAVCSLTRDTPFQRRTKHATLVENKVRTSVCCGSSRSRVATELNESFLTMKRVILYKRSRQSGSFSIRRSSVFLQPDRKSRNTDRIALRGNRQTENREGRTLVIAGRH